MPLRPPAGFIRPGFDPLKNPDAPTGVAATGGDTSASVSFTPPANVGGSAISAYYAVSNPGQITGTAASSPISVTGLTNGTPYTFTVWALNTYGPGPYSAASGSVTPAAVLGLFGGGSNGNSTNVIQYISISSTGNAIDFGDLISPRENISACASSVRGIFAGGGVNVIQYVTIASTGNATDFGDLLNNPDNMGGLSNSTRGIFAGGYTNERINVIQYITIASVGNAIDFGDLTETVYGAGGCSNATRGLSGGGYNGSINTNVIAYVTIASAGNATDFGDCTVSVYARGACSNAHGGL